MKFKIGNMVKVRENLKADKFYGCLWFVDEMTEYCGKTATIIGTYKNMFYFLNIDNETWGWSAEMLEPYNPNEIKIALTDINPSEIAEQFSYDLKIEKTADEMFAELEYYKDNKLSTKNRIRYFNCKWQKYILVTKDVFGIHFKKSDISEYPSFDESEILACAQLIKEMEE